MNRQKLEEFGNTKMLKEREVVIGRRPWERFAYKDGGGGREGRGFENPQSSLCAADLTEVNLRASAFERKFAFAQTMDEN